MAINGSDPQFYINSDVKEKVEILETFRAATNLNRESFGTIKTMMEYEKENNLLEKKGYVSGSRTLLRLHRGLGRCLVSYHLVIVKWLVFRPHKDLIAGAAIKRQIDQFPLLVDV